MSPYFFNNILPPPAELILIVIIGVAGGSFLGLFALNRTSKTMNAILGLVGALGGAVLSHLILQEFDMERTKLTIILSCLGTVLVTALYNAYIMTKKCSKKR